MTQLHPALVLLLTAGIAPLATGNVRRAVLLLGGLATIACVAVLDPGSAGTVSIAGYALDPVRVDALSKVFGLIFAAIAVVGVIYGLGTARIGETSAALVYAAGALGVTFAGDWLSLLAFWELMGIASLLVIWAGGTARSRAAGYRYLLVHAAGGSLFLAGIAVHLSGGGPLEVQALSAPEAGTSPLAFGLILTGVAINAAIPPLNAWLTDSYPEATPSGSVFLSAFTTKSAVYVLLRVFPGTELLVYAGVFMALYGVVYAVLENDIRRLLGYHIVSQVGYMVAGAGMGTAMAVDGATAHAVCHILYKSLLFMGCGALIAATGRRHLTDLGGIHRQMPWVFGLYMVGAFSISGFPLFNGFVSKSMVISAAAEAHRPFVEILLTLASVGTFLHTGLKLPWFAFVARNPDPAVRGFEVRPVGRPMIVAMAIGAFFCTLLGCVPGLLYAELPGGAAGYHPYTADHVLSALQLLGGTALGFFLYLGKLGGEATVSVDTEWIYRKPLPVLVDGITAGARSIGQAMESTRIRLVETVSPYVRSPFRLAVRIGIRPSAGIAETLSAALPEPTADGEALPAEQPDFTPELSEVGDYDEDAHRLPIGLNLFWVVVYFALVALAAWLGLD